MRTLATLLILILLLLCAAPAHAEITAAQAQALLTAWLTAQNRGDLAAYQALYAAGFRGVRRSGARVTRLDRAGWIQDRARMFRRPMKVAATAPQISPAEGGVALLFEQTWASGSYRDVGQKRMVLIEEGGAARIASEEMISSDLRPEPLKPAEAALVRCLFPTFDEPHRQVGGARVEAVSAAQSGPLRLAAIQLTGRPTAVGVCGEDGQPLGLTSLPARDSYVEACMILDASNCEEQDRRLQLGAIRIDPRFFEVSPGEWAFAVERSASADSSDEQGPGEEVRVTTLYAFHRVGGKLTRVLTLPSEGGRSDVELSDGFTSSFAQERPGELRLTRTLSKGVYPDGRKETTRRLRFRWNGRRLTGG